MTNVKFTKIKFTFSSSTRRNSSAKLLFAIKLPSIRKKNYRKVDGK